MGNKILIYHDGQRYEIDSDLIYMPWFVAGRRSGKTTMAMEFKKRAQESGLSVLNLGAKNEEKDNLSEIT